MTSGICNSVGAKVNVTGKAGMGTRLADVTFSAVSRHYFLTATLNVVP